MQLFLGKILLFHINPAWHQVVPNLFPLGPPVAGEVECGKNARVEDLHPARVEDLHCSVHCTLEVSELPFECSLAGADLLASNLVPSRNFPQQKFLTKIQKKVKDVTETKKLWGIFKDHLFVVRQALHENESPACREAWNVSLNTGKIHQLKIEDKDNQRERFKE